MSRPWASPGHADPQVLRGKIVARSPLRISLGGGGTDLPSYYRAHSGFLVAAAINRYVYASLKSTSFPGLVVNYGGEERVLFVAELRHPIVREAFRLLKLEGRYLELTSMADVVGGTGLGSSGSFTTALLAALHNYREEPWDPRQLAEEACHTEINRLGEPIGKQDQYIAAFGGLRCFEFRPDGWVDVQPLRLDSRILQTLEENLLLFFTGYTRSASTILREQDNRTRGCDREILENLDRVRDLGRRSKAALEAGDLAGFAGLMNLQWGYKKRRSAFMSNAQIEAWYDLALHNGARGGKLVGAGGGGFLLFYAEDAPRLRRAMASCGLSELPFRFELEGTKVVVPRG